ncbi:CinA family protein [Salinimonas chungwhensis]|uniref:CinA family protein n=1 Tax=Salinimonas chungwhensis TaxID=265425 RepID=UPI000376FC7C|nr:CinA family protein [Salinimonas chungwhensis]
MGQTFSTVSVASQSQQIITRIGQLLTANGLTISCAESCTGGGLAFAFTSVAGSSNWFEQSFVTYSNTAKQTLLGVEASVLLNDGAVSQRCVEAMVQGIAKRTGANVGVSISGIAGPGGGSEAKPVGTVWFGFYLSDQIVTVKQIFDGDRDSVRSQAVAFALQYLHDWLVENYQEAL